MGTSGTGETQVYRYAEIQGEEIRREADSGRREIRRKMYLTPLFPSGSHKFAMCFVKFAKLIFQHWKEPCLNAVP